MPTGFNINASSVEGGANAGGGGTFDVSQVSCVWNGYYSFAWDDLNNWNSCGGGIPLPGAAVMVSVPGTTVTRYAFAFAPCTVAVMGYVPIALAGVAVVVYVVSWSANRPPITTVSCADAPAVTSVTATGDRPFTATANVGPLGKLVSVTT